jgi:hypothetical protein
MARIIAGYSIVLSNERKLENIYGLVIFFLPSITALALVMFSPLRQLRQPARLIVIGVTNGANQLSSAFSPHPERSAKRKEMNS